MAVKSVRFFKGSYFLASLLEMSHCNWCALCLCFQITIVSFLVSDSIPFTTVELLQIEPADMTVDGAADRVQIIGKKQGAKGPVSFIHSIPPFLVKHLPFSHAPIPILRSHSSFLFYSMSTFPFSFSFFYVYIPILQCFHSHSSSSMLNLTWWVCSE